MRTAAILAVLAAGCSASPGRAPTSPAPAPAGSTPEPTSPDIEAGRTAWSACGMAFTRTGDPAADVVRLGQPCARAFQLRALGPPRDASQSDADPVDRFTFAGAGGKRCYRLLAVTESSVRSIDLLVRDPTGAEVAFVASDAGFALVPRDGPLCPERAGTYEVEIGVAKGSGRYAVQVFEKAP